MAKRKRHLKKYGPKPIGYEAKKLTHYGYKTFTLAEHLGGYVDAKVAQAEYQGMGFYSHIEPVAEAAIYYVWLGPKRKRKVRLLPGEIIHRHKRRHLRAVS